MKAQPSVVTPPSFRLHSQMARSGRFRSHVRWVRHVRAHKFERRAIGREYAQIVSCDGFVLWVRRQIFDLRSKGDVRLPEVLSRGARQRAGAGEIDRFIAADDRLHGSALKRQSQIMRDVFPLSQLRAAGNNHSSEIMVREFMVPRLLSLDGGIARNFTSTSGHPALGIVDEPITGG